MSARDLAATIARMRAELLADVLGGAVPPSVRSFADVHEHVDGNEYGGLCEDGFDPSSEEDARFVSRVQSALDAWIRDGGLRAALADRADYCAELGPNAAMTALVAYDEAHRA